MKGSEIYLNQLYSVELNTLATELTSFAKLDQPSVESTYNIPFSVDETLKILRAYMDFATTQGRGWEKSNESQWLADNYFNYIVNRLSGGSSFTTERKGLRDRVWVILAGLVKYKNLNSSYFKYWNPVGWTPTDENKKFENPMPSPIPPNDQQKENKQNTTMIAIIGAVIVAGISKMIKLW